MTGTLDFTTVFDVERLSRLPTHPLATIYRPIDSVSFTRLKEDMRENGHKRAVSVWRGALIDGRARIAAAREVGWQYLTVNDVSYLSSNDLIDYVWTLNHEEGAHRAAHTVGQRAMAAYRLYKLMREPGSRNYPVPRLEQKDIGVRLGVGNGSITRAGVIYRHGTAGDIEAVDSGDTQVATVARYIQDKRGKAPAKNTTLEKFKVRHSITRSANTVRGNAIATIGTMGIVLRENSNAPLPSEEVREQWLTELEEALQWLNDLRAKILNGRGGL